MNEHMEKYRGALEEMLRNITDELKTVGIHNPENPEDWIAVPEGVDAEEPDVNVQADTVESWNERRALVADLETRYNALVAALGRIKDGTFGICEVCKKEIEPERLDANPASRTCIEHKEEEGAL